MASPTTSQAVAQVKALTQQNNALNSSEHRDHQAPARPLLMTPPERNDVRSEDTLPKSARRAKA